MNKIPLQLLGCIALVFAASAKALAQLPISDSVMKKLESVEQFPQNKYSDRYYQEIREALNRAPEKIRVVTYNILFDVFDDQLVDKTNSWQERLPRVLASIENMQPDLLCLQEVYPAQLADLQEALKENYNSFVGDSTSGEMNALFYKKERFDIDLSTFSYGDTDLSSASLAMPLNTIDEEIVAKIPNLLPPELEPGRQMVLAHFLDKQTQKSFALLNTHLTYYRVNSREEQAFFIQDLVQKLHAIDKPVILTGDFNTSPNRPDFEDLRFQDGNHIKSIFEAELKDSQEAALLGHVGPLSTFTADFTDPNSKAFTCTGTPGVILDHIYVSPQIAVLANATEPSRVEGKFPSDHLPVVADIVLP